jgi:hypothetical protein
MKPTLEIVNWAEFQKDLNRAVAISSRGAAESLNSRGYMLAKRAMDYTKRAMRAEIEALGVTGYRVIKSKKTGTLKKGRPIYSPSDKAVAIVASRLVAAGQKIDSHASLVESAKKMIAARLRSITFLASGWIPAMRKLDKYARQKVRATAKQWGKPKGTARPAKETFNPFVEIENNVTPTPRGQQMLRDGLAKAIAKEHAELKSHLERSLKEGFVSAGATIR